MIFKSQEERKRNRRSMLRRRFITFTVTGIGALFAYRWWKFRPVPVSQRNTDYLTTNGSFFTVSIQPGFRPNVDPEAYRLAVAGPAGAVEVDLAQIRSLPSLQMVRTLACVGNGVGGTGMGNAEWTVVPLRSVVAAVVGEAPDGLFATFYGMDGFYSSVPLSVALDPETVLAFEMNGKSLPLAHGYPLRVLIPGRYGMKQPRWLERIVISTDDPGYWERRGWCDECRIHMTARIDSVREQADGVHRVSGVAFCGAVPVGAVSVSEDGENWFPAVLGEKPLPNAWSTWSFNWLPKSKGEVVLTARAIDAQGIVQEAGYSGAFPSGTTGLHRVVVQV
jgi:DMSO/TMAO reductase YedYZ molybdopterin-dependent catalytic subunit